MLNNQKILEKNTSSLPRLLILKLKNKLIKKIILIPIISVLLLLLVYHEKIKTVSLFKKEKIYLDQYETNIFYQIKQKLIENHCSDMWANQREFLNGVIRKFLPKKILEIGVNRGGSSIIL